MTRANHHEVILRVNGVEVELETDLTGDPQTLHIKCPVPSVPKGNQESFRNWVFFSRISN